MRESLLYVSNNYINESHSDFQSNTLAKFIRQDLPQVVSSFFPNDNYSWVASPGRGNWTVCPWLAIFNKIVTTSAQEGYYPVYLF